MYNYARLSSITRPSGIYAIQRLLRVLYDKGEGTLRGFLSDFCKCIKGQQQQATFMF